MKFSIYTHGILAATAIGCAVGGFTVVGAIGGLAVGLGLSFVIRLLSMA